MHQLYATQSFANVEKNGGWQRCICCNRIIRLLTRSGTMQANEKDRLPILRGPVDRLRDGQVAFKETQLADHPVETIQKVVSVVHSLLACRLHVLTASLLLQHFSNDFNTKMYTLGKIQGTHAAWERQMDRAVLSQIQRLPGGPPSSHALLDTLMGRDDKIDFEDILNLPEQRPNMPKVGVHEAVEARLKF